ncbi:MAG: hypothetical protein RBJ76_09230 [Stenomitos frigidus ULC029]
MLFSSDACQSSITLVSDILEQPETSVRDLKSQIEIQSAQSSRSLTVIAPF